MTMDTKNMEDIYGKLANKINEMIPENWTKVLLYAQISTEVSVVYFYYYPENNNSPIYSLDIPRKFGINKATFNAVKYKIIELLKMLQEEFGKNKQPLWTNLTFILENTGEFKIDYNYDDMINSNNYDQRIIWEYVYLGIKPSSDRLIDLEILGKYLNSIKKID